MQESNEIISNPYLQRTHELYKCLQELKQFFITCPFLNGEIEPINSNPSICNKLTDSLMHHVEKLTGVAMAFMDGTLNQEVAESEKGKERVYANLKFIKSKTGGFSFDEGEYSSYIPSGLMNLLSNEEQQLINNLPEYMQAIMIFLERFLIHGKLGLCSSIGDYTPTEIYQQRHHLQLVINDLMELRRKVLVPIFGSKSLRKAGETLKQAHSNECATHEKNKTAQEQLLPLMDNITKLQEQYPQESHRLQQCRIMLSVIARADDANENEAYTDARMKQFYSSIDQWLKTKIPLEVASLLTQIKEEIRGLINDPTFHNKKQLRLPPEIVAGVGELLPLKDVIRASRACRFFGENLADTVKQKKRIISIVQMAAGSHHKLYLKGDGTVWGCGLNTFGQLGLGCTYVQPVPVQLQGFSQVIQVAAGDGFSLFLNKDGTVLGCGSNRNGQLGIPGSSEDITSEDITQLISLGVNNIKQVAAGHSHALLLQKDGTVLGSGNNEKKQLGLDSRHQACFVPISTSKIKQIAAMNVHSILLTEKGKVLSYYQINSEEVKPFSPIILLQGVKQISAGRNHVVFLMENGTVWGMGDNTSGQLGTDDSAYPIFPMPISGLSDIKQVFAGSFCTFFLKNEGTVWCCGGNLEGELGLGNTDTQTTPVQLLGLDDIEHIFSQGYHTLFVKRDGTTWVCGNNVYGPLTSEFGSHVITPVRLVLNPIQTPTLQSEVDDTRSRCLVS